jgi:hypothetical protein
MLVSVAPGAMVQHLPGSDVDSFTIASNFFFTTPLTWFLHLHHGSTMETMRLFAALLHDLRKLPGTIPKSHWIVFYTFLIVCLSDC